MDDINENIEEYNPNKECKILIVFGDMVADMLSNEKNSTNSNRIIFIRKFYFPVQKNIKLNSSHYFIVKIHSKWF